MMIDYQQRLARFAQLAASGDVDTPTGPVRLGVDLGTGNIVLAVVDDADQPVAAAMQASTVVRDGIVVDWLGAVQVVTALRKDLERRIGVELSAASIAVPPGIDEATAKIFGNVVEACGMKVANIVDEPVAAALALGFTDGAVIDVGHGTTGVSILKAGEVVKSIDQATGGHHQTLVISGALKIDYDQAEQLKKNPSQADLVFGIIRPTLERMASIAKQAIGDQQLDAIVLVGGASSLPQSAELFSQILGQPVIRPDHPLFPTPLGTALWKEQLPTQQSAAEPQLAVSTIEPTAAAIDEPVPAEPKKAPKKAKRTTKKSSQQRPQSAGGAAS